MLTVNVGVAGGDVWRFSIRQMTVSLHCFAFLRSAAAAPGLFLDYSHIQSTSTYCDGCDAAPRPLRPPPIHRCSSSHLTADSGQTRCLGWHWRNGPRNHSNWLPHPKHFPPTLGQFSCPPVRTRQGKLSHSGVSVAVFPPKTSRSPDNRLRAACRTDRQETKYSPIYPPPPPATTPPPHTHTRHCFDMWRKQIRFFVSYSEALCI